MIHIKQFINKVSIVEGKQGRDLVMTISDARGLRDELSRLLADLHEQSTTEQKSEDTIRVEIKGGTFK